MPVLRDCGWPDAATFCTDDREPDDFLRLRDQGFLRLPCAGRTTRPSVITFDPTVPILTGHETLELPVKDGFVDSEGRMKGSPEFVGRESYGRLFNNIALWLSGQDPRA